MGLSHEDCVDMGYLHRRGVWGKASAGCERFSDARKARRACGPCPHKIEMGKRIEKSNHPP